MTGDVQQVVERLDELAASSRRGVEVPDIEMLLPRRRRWPRWVAVAAAAAVIAVLASVVVSRDDRSDVRTVDSPETLVGTGPYLLPTVWPEELTGEVVTTEASGEPTTSLADTWLLALDGRASAIAVVMNLPPGSGSPLDGAGERLVIDGRDASVASSGAGVTVSVALDDGRALSVTSQVVERATLEALTASMADAIGDATAPLDPGRLLSGWSVADDEAGVSESFVSGGVPPASWNVARRDGAPINVPSRMFVAGVQAADVVASLATVAAVYPDAESVDIAGGASPGLMRTIPDLGVVTLIWAYDEHTLASVSGMGLSREQVLDAARSVRAVPREAWGA